MITLFLNGGVSPADYPASAKPLVKDLLAQLPTPVAALPSGEFVHGAFSHWNALFDGDGQLTDVHGAEGFGRGTRVIDHVALMAALATAGRVDLAEVVGDHARTVGGDGTFKTCVVHRALTLLRRVNREPDAADTLFAAVAFLASFLKT
jgi:hypothetical protein